MTACLSKATEAQGFFVAIVKLLISTLKLNRSAEAQGLMIKRSSCIEQMEEVFAMGGPGSAIKMQ
jgi:hypothetical protein